MRLSRVILLVAVGVLTLGLAAAPRAVEVDPFPLWLAAAVGAALWGLLLVGATRMAGLALGLGFLTAGVTMLAIGEDHQDASILAELLRVLAPAGVVTLGALVGALPQALRERSSPTSTMGVGLLVGAVFGMVIWWLWLVFVEIVVRGSPVVSRNLIWYVVYGVGMGLLVLLPVAAGTIVTRLALRRGLLVLVVLFAVALALLLAATVLARIWALSGGGL